MIHEVGTASTSQAAAAIRTTIVFIVHAATPLTNAMARLSLADVAHEVFVVRAVDPHPDPAQAGEVVVERLREERRPHPDEQPTQCQVDEDRSLDQHVSRARLCVPRAHWGGLERDRQAVPEIDHRDRANQIRERLVVELGTGRGEHFVAARRAHRTASPRR